MIIGIGVWLPVAPVFSASERVSPDPVAFSTRMELGDLRQAEAWLDGGMPVDFMGSRIGSGLMIGAWEGRQDLMQLFVSRGADINRANANGETAIALAAWRGHLDAVKWLVEHGAKINGSKRQWSALHYAVFAGHANVADYLIERGADVNARSTNGSTVLMMAVYEGHQELARQLLEKGADRGPKNDWGEGALEWAMRHNHLEIARMVSSPEAFNAAVSQPKETWGEPVRSLRTSKGLEKLLAERDTLLERGLPTGAVDQQIAAERVRLVRAEMDRQSPVRAAAMEISASRKKPQDQSAKMVYDDEGKAVGFKVPDATYRGTPKMPPKAPVRNF